MLYGGTFLQAAQKIKGGYLITAYRPYWQDGGPFGVAYLETKIELLSDKPFCGWFYYVGKTQYTAINGFLQSVPHLRVYTGDAPIENNACPDRIGVKKKPSFQIKYQ